MMLGRVAIPSEFRASKVRQDPPSAEKKEETEAAENMETDRNALETGREMITENAK